MGAAFEHLGQRDSAEEYFKRSTDLNKKLNTNKTDRQYNLIKLAKLYINERRFPKAFEILNEERQLSNDLSDHQSYDDSIEVAYRRTDVSWNYYYGTNDYKNAIASLQEHHSLQEKKWNAIYEMVQNDLLRGIHERSDDLNIQMLDKDIQIKKQTNVISVLVAIIIIGFCMAFIIRYRKSIANYRLINSISFKKEEELRIKIEKNKRNYIALIENTNDWLWSVDQDYNLLAFNNAYRDFSFRVSGKYPEIGKPDLLKEIDPLYYYSNT